MTNVHELITYDITTAALQEMADRYLPLRVLDFSDEQGYAVVKQARNEVRAVRLSVEKRRKELKAEALEFGRLVDGRAKDIQEKIADVEGHLETQLAIVDDEKKRQQEEAMRKAAERYEYRLKALVAVGAAFDPNKIQLLSDEDFEDLLDAETTRHNAAQRKIKEEQAELEKLRAEQAENAAKVRAQEDETRRLQAELLASQQAELKEKQAAIDAANTATREAERKAAEEKAAYEKEQREYQAVLDAQKAAEEKAKADAEAEARKQVADNELFDRIKAEFPTLQSAWAEIARLRNELGEATAWVDDPCLS